MAWKYSFGRATSALVLVASALAIGAISHQVAAQQIQDKTSEEASAAQVDEKKPEKKKREPIYDESADAQQQIATALKKAKKENQRVLIQWGGNWCHWCYLLHDKMKQDAKIAGALRDDYQVVFVDVGSFDRNKDLLEKFEADIKTNGLPFLTILDSDGKVVTNQETSSLEVKGKQEHDAEAVLEFITKHKPEPLIASEVLEAAFASAKDSKKLVFLHFGAPWCGWCHYLEDWMAEEEQQVLHEYFVDVKVDTDRMVGGQELMKKYCPEPQGIPWFAFIDPSSNKVVADSTSPDGGNVGFPSADEEIDYFAEMLKKCGERFPADKISALKKSLVANREKREAARARQIKEMEKAKAEQEAAK